MQTPPAAYEDPEITFDTGSADVPATRTMQDYLVPYGLALQQQWFLAGKPPPLVEHPTARR